MDFETLHDRVTSILAEGLTPDAVADAICAAVGLEKPAPPESPPLPDDDPAVTGVPRDETEDSVDQHTGTLTDDAVAKRAKLAEDQAKRDADAVAVTQADAALAEAQANDKAAHDLFDADSAAVSADEAALAGDDTTAG